MPNTTTPSNSHLYTIVTCGIGAMVFTAFVYGPAKSDQAEWMPVFSLLLIALWAAWLLLIAVSLISWALVHSYRRRPEPSPLLPSTAQDDLDDSHPKDQLS